MPFLQLHLRHCLSHRGLPQQTGSLSTLLLTVLEAAKFKIKALADLYPVRACLLGYWVTESCLLIIASHVRDKGSNTLISLRKAIHEVSALVTESPPAGPSPNPGG